VELDLASSGAGELESTGGVNVFSVPGVFGLFLLYVRRKREESDSF
jgi:hypothetical protein